MINIYRSFFLRILQPIILISFIFSLFFTAIPPVKAIGISPPDQNFGLIPIGEKQQVKMSIFRSRNATSLEKDLVVAVKPVALGKDGYSMRYFIGPPQVVFPVGVDSAQYIFEIVPDFSKSGEDVLHLMFEPKGSSVDFAGGTGASVVAGAIALFRFSTVAATVADQKVIPIPPDGKVTMSKTESRVAVISKTQLFELRVDKDTVSTTLMKPTVDFSAFLSEGKAVLPEVKIISENAGNTAVNIPASTEIKSSDPLWDGTIIAPTLATLDLSSDTTSTKTVSLAVEVGAPNIRLTFDKGVRLLLPGQAGKKAMYSINGTSVTAITSTCDADTQTVGDALPANSECQVTVGDDIVIWTKHFTTFATYTESVDSSQGSSSSVPSISSGVASTQTNEQTPSTATTETNVVIPTNTQTKAVTEKTPVQETINVPKTETPFQKKNETIQKKSVVLNKTKKQTVMKPPEKPPEKILLKDSVVRKKSKLFAGEAPSKPQINLRFANEEKADYFLVSSEEKSITVDKPKFKLFNKTFGTYVYRVIAFQGKKQLDQKEFVVEVAPKYPSLMIVNIVVQKVVNFFQYAKSLF